jgi:hypothetical protein
MRVPPIPEGFHTVTPNMIVHGVERAIEFCKKAFGTEEKLRLTMPDGAITHCYPGRTLEVWRPQGDSNPCYRRERAVS